MMLHFTWSDTYAIGLPDIDAQHRVILRLVERLQEQHEAGVDASALADILAETRRYILYHLSTEEALLQLYEYPELFDHKREHAEFMCDLEDRIRRCESGELSVNKVILFIIGWFVSHSTHEDRRYVSHVLARRQELGLLVEGERSP